MNEIVWQDPPPRGPRGRGRAGAPDPRRVAMDANPGRWLLWAENMSTSIVTRLRKQGYEAVSRDVDKTTERGTIYARRPEGWTP